MATTLVVNKGKGIIAQRMFGATPSQAEPKYIGWGTGAGTTGLTDVDLFSPAAEARVAGSASAVTTTQTNDTHQVTGTVTSLSAQTITNAGLFDAAGAGSPPSGGNLYVKGDFTGQPLNTSDSLIFTFKIQFT